MTGIELIHRAIQRLYDELLAGEHDAGTVVLHPEPDEEGYDVWVTVSLAFSDTQPEMGDDDTLYRHGHVDDL